MLTYRELHIREDGEQDKNFAVTERVAVVYGPFVLRRGADQKTRRAGG